MDIKKLSDALSVSGQITANDFAALKAQGVTTIINNRPDGEQADQPASDSLAARAAELGLDYHYIPVTPGALSDGDAMIMGRIIQDSAGPVHAFCRSGNRSSLLWKRSEELRVQPKDNDKSQTAKTESVHHKILVVGGGSAGIAVTASLLKRNPGIDIAVIEPRDDHYYQPGWTLVGGGIFKAFDTKRLNKNLIPSGAKWIKGAVATFQPDNNAITLSDGTSVSYDYLIAAPGLQLDFDKIEGLTDTLGKNGVTSNYRYDLAPYTWDLVQGLKSGTAIFTQPPMPIKCAGAPQKAMYLSCDHWRRNKVLKDIDVKFCNTGGVIFGVKAFVPELMKYNNKYGTELNFGEQLIKVDGPNQTAWFKKVNSEEIVERTFDMLHVCPPQSAPDFIKSSPLAAKSGWVEVDHHTLQHVRYANVYGLGDATTTPNAKTLAAARKQAPIVAANLTAQMNGQSDRAQYDGYGACPLTVERGKIVMAEFGYGGKLLPVFPVWALPGTKATRRSWHLKASMLPMVYWNQMLKGKEYLAKPVMKPATEKATESA